MFGALGEALTNLLTPQMLLLCLVGTIAGMALGATPGLSATVGLALLLPITFTLDPTTALVLMGAFYMGAIYGGAFTAILVNAPGTPSSIGTTFDGFPMTQQGRSEHAVIGVTVASVLGGVIGVIGLFFLAPLLADFVLQFGPQEYFWLGIFGLTMVASLASGSLVKGFIGGFLGLLISVIGVAPIGGEVRFTFGYSPLQGGVPLIVALIGFFTIPTIIDMMTDPESRAASMRREAHSRREGGVLAGTLRRVLSRPVNLIRSSVIGTFVGMLPGAGGNVANLIAYNEAKRASKEPERFGKGEVHGVVAPEAANNAVVGGGLVPLLTLGIPGAPPDAIIYGVLILHGLRPGADLFTSQGPIVFTFILAIGLAALLMGPVGLIGGRALQRLVVRTPTHYLAPAVMLLTIVGAYAAQNSVLDVVVMLVLGFAGYGLRRLGVPPPTIVLGVVLGPIIERGFVQGLRASAGLDQPWISFFTRPISIVIMLLVVAALAWVIVTGRRQRERQGPSGAEQGGGDAADSAAPDVREDTSAEPTGSAGDRAGRSFHGDDGGDEHREVNREG